MFGYSDATAKELALENARVKKDLVQKLAAITREHTELSDSKARLVSETTQQQASMTELRARIAAFQEQVTKMTPTDQFDEVSAELAETIREKIALQESLTDLQTEHSAAKVTAAELGENYNILRTEFKLLLSQPQFKNIRVNNKISRLLNEGSSSSGGVGVGGIGSLPGSPTGTSSSSSSAAAVALK